MASAPAGALPIQQIAGGTDAIIVCGTTGESSTLTHEEHLEVIRFCIEKVKLICDGLLGVEKIGGKTKKNSTKINSMAKRSFFI